MIKIIFKTLSIIFLFLILLVFYLSYFGIKTDKFNNKITKKILEIDKRINLNLDNVNYLINPYNFTVNVETINPKINFEDIQLEIKSMKANISLKALLSSKLLIDEIQITTKEIKINDVILLVRSFKNSTELFLLNEFIKNGFLTTDIKLNFDDTGRIKDDYQINGFIKKGELKFLNQFNFKNLNFDFNINKNQYSLTQIKTDFNDIKISSKLIQLHERKNHFLVKGNIETKEKNFETEQLKILFSNFLKNLDIKKIRFSSVNDFSFNITKKLRINDFNIE